MNFVRGISLFQKFVAILKTIRHFYHTKVGNYFERSTEIVLPGFLRKRHYNNHDFQFEFETEFRFAYTMLIFNFFPGQGRNEDILVVR